jgi:hypothetical protein
MHRRTNLSDDIMTIREAARRLGLAHSTICRQINQGKIKRRPDGRVSLAEVERDRSRNISHMHRGAPANAQRAADLTDDGQAVDDVHEAWREHWCLFASQHGPVIATKLGVDEGTLRRELFLHVLSHLAAILPGDYRDPLAKGEGEP